MTATTHDLAGARGRITVRRWPNDDARYQPGSEPGSARPAGAGAAEVLGEGWSDLGTSTSGILPAAGSSHWVLGGIGAALFGAGQLLLAWGRRRRA